MRSGIISDVHSNLEAFTAVLSRLDESGIDRIVCLGDIVGYGADPVECLELTEEKCEIVLAGNHDYAVGGKHSVSGFNPDAAEAITWTRNVISGSWDEYLSSLPLIYEEEGIVFVHASPHKPERWSYIVSRQDAISEFRYFKKSAAFVGHSHIAGIYCHDGDTFDAEVILDENKRYIINVGSVGQPRDGNPSASFAVYDYDTKKISIERVEYDYKSAAKKILEAGLPSYLGSRLELGI